MIDTDFGPDEGIRAGQATSDPVIRWDRSHRDGGSAYLPYAARVPSGSRWVGRHQYDTGEGGVGLQGSHRGTQNHLAAPKKMLIVDDDADIVELLSMVLESPGRVLLTAYDGQEALDVVHHERPDLVLTDVMMPRLDGRELCHRIKSDETLEDTKVVLITAVQDLNPAECGADGYVPKPFDMNRLAALVAGWLSS